VAAVAVLCVQPEPSYRPLITDVLHSLVPLVPVELGGTLRVAEPPSPNLKRSPCWDVLIGQRSQLHADELGWCLSVTYHPSCVPEDDCSNLPVAGWVEREFWFGKSCLLCLCLYKEVKETTLFSLEFRVLLYRSKFLQHYNIKNLRMMCFGFHMGIRALWLAAIFCFLLYSDKTENVYVVN
jgi:hypothetical protein